MAIIEYYIGERGPYFADDTDPTWSEEFQVIPQVSPALIAVHIDIIDGNPHGTNHGQLDDISVLDPTSVDVVKDRHLSDAQGKKWEDHVGSINGNPHGTDHSQLDAIAVLDPTSTTSTQDKHLSNLQANKWESTSAQVTSQGADLADPTGFVDPAGTTVTYDSAARTVTIAHAGNIYYYWNGVKRELGSAGTWTSSAHSTTLDVTYFLSTVDGTNFTWATSVWSFYHMQVAFVWYGTANKYAIRECHGSMSWSTHEEFHRIVGTYRVSGGNLGSYVLGSTTVGDRRPTVDSVLIHDEDVPTTNAALSNDLYTQTYLTGAGATTALTVDAAEIVPVSGNQPYYNQFTGGAWTQTLLPANAHMCVWLVALPVSSDAASQKYRFWWVQGQTQGTLASQQTLFPSDLNLGILPTLSTEFVFLAKVIIQYIGGNWDFISVTNLTGSRANTTGTAAAVYLSSVTTDTTLTGLGSAASPLGLLLTTDTTPVDTDLAVSLRGTGLLKTTWTNVKTFLKTYFDTLYAKVAGSSTQAFATGALTVTGTISASGDLQIGASNANTVLTVTGIDSGASNGVQLQLRNNTTNVLFLGGYSRIVGGAYDATATIYTSTAGVKTYIGVTGVVTSVSSTGLAVTGTITTNMSTTASAANVYHSADGTALLRSTSSLRYKQNIETLDTAVADNILNLRPVWYRSKAEADNAAWSYYGLIAEEVAEIEPRLVHFVHEGTKEVEASPEVLAVEAVLDEDGAEITPAVEYRAATMKTVIDTDSPLIPDGVQYERLSVMLLSIVQRQQTAIADLTTRLAALEAV